MDAGWVAVGITLLLGIPTLIYAKRSAAVGEKTLALDQRRLHLEKLANLELATRRGRPRLWHCIGRMDRQTAWFEASVRNRGPAYAVELEWSATIGSEQVNMGHPPEFLVPDPIDENQLMVELPLGPDLAPKREPGRVVVKFSDDEKRKAAQWCFRFAGDPAASTDEWTLENLDCLSLKPRSGTWAQPSPNQ
jgi:hypothetical protein